MNHEAQHDNPELAPNAKWVHETSAEVSQKPSLSQITSKIN